MTYGTSWFIVGNAGFSAGYVQWTSLASSSAGVPYVAYEDYGNDTHATIMKYDSVLIGTQEPYSMHISIHLNPASDKLVVDVPVNAQ